MRPTNSRTQEHDQMRRDVEQFLKGGGVIQQCDSSHNTGNLALWNNKTLSGQNRNRSRYEHRIPQMQELRAKGLSFVAIADQVGCSKETVQRLLRKAEHARG